jgi:hypothetical protein
MRDFDLRTLNATNGHTYKKHPMYYKFVAEMVGTGILRDTSSNFIRFLRDDKNKAECIRVEREMLSLNKKTKEPNTSECQPLTADQIDRMIDTLRGLEKVITRYCDLIDTKTNEGVSNESNAEK